MTPRKLKSWRNEAGKLRHLRMQRAALWFLQLFWQSGCLVSTVVAVGSVQVQWNTRAECSAEHRATDTVQRAPSWGDAPSHLFQVLSPVAWWIWRAGKWKRIGWLGKYPPPDWGKPSNVSIWLFCDEVLFFHVSWVYFSAFLRCN